MPTKVILGTDFLRKRAVIDLMSNNIRLFVDTINCSEIKAAGYCHSVDDLIEGTKFKYADYPFMRGLPLVPKQGDPDFRALMLDFIKKYDELEEKMGWVHNETYVYPINSDPSAVPVHNSPIIYNGLDREKVEKQIREWWAKGVIRLSQSPWAHQVLLAEQLKPSDSGYDMSSRVCPNLIPINEVTIPMSYPLPNPRMIIDRAVGKYKSILDNSKGYLRFKLREEDKYKTAFIVQNIDGLGDKFEFNYMPWGAMNAGRFYQERIDNNLRPTTIDGKVYSRNLKNECAEGFQDDVIIHSDTLLGHFEDLKETLSRLYAMKLPISWLKVRICVEELSYCGYRLTPEGIKQDGFRVKALSRMRPPASFPELDIFMGMANYHREFIKDYATVMKPLLDLQNSDRWLNNFRKSFGRSHLNTFRRFMSLIQQDTLLSRPGAGEYHVYTDMSETHM